MSFDVIPSLPHILVILYLSFSFIFSRFNKFVINRIYQDIKEPLLSDMVIVFQFLSLFYSGILTFISRFGFLIARSSSSNMTNNNGIMFIVLIIFLLFFVFVYLTLHKQFIRHLSLRIFITFIILAFNFYFIFLPVPGVKP